MPLYVYEHPETSEQIEIVQGMNDEHEYTDPNGTKWRRVFFVPSMNTDSSLDPFSEADFVRSTGSKKGTVGDMMDLSKELSATRAAQNGGQDPVKQKMFKDYKKQTGSPHPKSKPKIYESKNVRVEY